MIQAKEDVQEQENDNEVKVNERLTLKKLLQSGYTHADAVATMKEVYGEFGETDVDEREAEEGEVEEREAEEEEFEVREVGARVVPLGPGSYNIHWKKKMTPSKRIRKLKLKKMVQYVDGGGSTKTPWVLD
ncbi:unnamed protein product [Lactuca virosa]|uniref:Uncharacterized protein n=1 Tax=Lactuca virosa TaxID=75947 RepID=A0AAU9PVK7_9ASTR|nr:unnamed protein product [Lactuca virosa]